MKNEKSSNDDSKKMKFPVFYTYNVFLGLNVLQRAGKKLCARIVSMVTVCAVNRPCHGFRRHLDDIFVCNFLGTFLQTNV